MSSPPPRRRRRRPQSSSESDARAPRKRKKKSVNNGLLLKIALFACAGGVFLGGIFMMDWREIGRGLGLPSAQERLLNRVLAIKAEQADLLASIRDEASARAAGQGMNDLSVEIAETMQEARDMKKDKSYQISPEEDKELSERFKTLNAELEARIKQEMERIMKNTSLRPIMSEIQRDVRFALMDAKSEMRKKSLRADANAEGFSAVTSWTSLSPGDEVEALYNDVRWQPGKVVEVADDGRVKVHLDMHRGIGSFDEFYDRSQLRIPD